MHGGAGKKMKLSKKLISRIEARLEETKQFRFGEVVVRFIRHEGRFAKVRIECYDKDIEEISNGEKQ
ncbi:hypothetical protein ES705_26101 [subsurface metagenome]